MSELPKDQDYVVTDASGEWMLCPVCGGRSTVGHPYEDCPRCADGRLAGRSGMTRTTDEARKILAASADSPSPEKPNV